MSQVTEQSVRFQTALASIKLIQASAVLDLTEDDFDFLTSNKVWIATDRSRARRCVEACVYGTLDFVGYPRFPARSEERFSRNAETDLVCRLLLEKKKQASQGFRLGGINDPINIPLCSQQDSITFSGHDSWQDEKAVNYEIGAKYRFFGGRGALNGSAFYMDIRDLQFFFFNGSASSEIYTLSLHDALPILR